MAAPRTQRLGWLAQELSKGKSNAQIIIDGMASFPGVSETTMRKDLKEILQRITDIELENLPTIKARLMEVGWKLMEEARQLAQLGPAVTQFKTLAIISGAMSEKSTETTTNNTGVPESTQVRERIAIMMRNKKLREDAVAAGIDLEALKDK